MDNRKLPKLINALDALTSKNANFTSLLVFHTSPNPIDEYTRLWATDAHAGAIVDIETAWLEYAVKSFILVKISNPYNENEVCYTTPKKAGAYKPEQFFPTPSIMNVIPKLNLCTEYPRKVFDCEKIQHLKKLEEVYGTAESKTAWLPTHDSENPTGMSARIRGGLFTFIMPLKVAAFYERNTEDTKHEDLPGIFEVPKIEEETVKV